MIIGDAYIAVKGDTKGFEGSTEKGVTSAVGGIAKKAALIFGAAFSAREAIHGIKDALGAAEESNKVAADSAAVIKSTGGAANITAAQMGKLADTLSLKTGVDDEAIQSSENMLATFTNLRNEVGKGNDIFNQASAIAVDMGAKFKNGPAAASVQLGKALNDPIKGITALTRVGVSFTDQQKDQIKMMVASGNTVGAQKIILGELSKEFGGVAAATGTATDKIKVGLDNMKEDFGKAIEPAISQLFPTLTATVASLSPVLQQLGGVIGQTFVAIGPAITSIASAIAPVLGAIGESLKSLGPVLAPLIGAVGSIVKALAPLLPAFSYLIATVLQAVTPLIDAFGKELGPVIQQLEAVIVGVVTAIGPSLRTLGGVFATIFKAIGPVITQLVSDFRPLIPIIGQVAGILAGALGGAIKAIAPVIAQLATFFGQAFRAMVPIILQLVKAVAPLLPVFGRVAAIIGGALLGVMKTLLPIIVTLASTFAGVLGKTIKALTPAIETIAKVIAKLAPILGQIVGVFGKILTALLPVLPVLGDLVSTLVEALAPILPIVADALLSIVKAIQPIIPIVVDLVKQLGPILSDVLKALAPALGSIVKALAELLTALLPILPPILKLAVMLIEKIGAPLLVKIAQAVALMAEAMAKLVQGITAVVRWIAHLDFGAIAHAMGTAVDKVVGFVTGLPGRIASGAKGLFKAVVDEASKLPGQVWDFIKKVPDKIGGIAGAIALKAADLGVKLIDGLIKGLGGLAKKAGDLANKMIDAVKDLGKGILNGVIDAINNMLPDRIGKITVAGYTIFPGINLPDNPIPHLADGGLIRRTSGGVPVLVGEGRTNEAVLPLPDGLLEGLQRIAAGAIQGQSGPLWSVGSIQLLSQGDGVRHAREFLDQAAAEAWLEGASA